MTPFFLRWMICNVLLGGLLLSVGSLLAARSASPVRRLRILEFTLIAALLTPMLATVQMPWQWSLKWLPATAKTVSETEPSTGETDHFTVSQPPMEIPAYVPPPPRRQEVSHPIRCHSQFRARRISRGWNRPHTSRARCLGQSRCDRPDHPNDGCCEYCDLVADRDNCFVQHLATVSTAGK